MVAFRTDDRDLAKLDKRARGIGRMAGTDGLMAEIASAMQAWTDLRFETETAPDGTPWKPSRRAVEQGGQTLSDSGRLRQSNTAAHGRRFAEIGNNLVYGGVHQLGATIVPRQARALVFKIGGRTVTAQKVVIPKREYLGIGADDEQEIAATVSDFLDRGVAPGGLA